MIFVSYVALKLIVFAAWFSSKDKEIGILFNWLEEPKSLAQMLNKFNPLA